MVCGGGRRSERAHLHVSVREQYFLCGTGVLVIVHECMSVTTCTCDMLPLQLKLAEAPLHNTIRRTLQTEITAAQRTWLKLL